MRRYTLSQHILEKLCIFLMLGTLVWIILRYGKLPEQIPTHFDLQGNVDGYGKRGNIWFLYGTDVVLSVMMLLFGRLLPVNSKTVNIPWTVSEQAWPFVVKATIDMMLWIALECTVMFIVPTIELMYGVSESASILVLAAVMIATCAIFLVKIRNICKYNTF